MTTRAKRLLLAVCCATTAFAVAPLRTVHACGLYVCLPQLAGVTPLQIVLDGKPVHITLTGVNLSSVNAVIVAPLVATQGFTAPNDQTLVVTLPANIAPGIYAVRVVAPDGASDPSFAPQFQVFPAPPTPEPTVAPTPRPKPTLTPVPTPKPPVPETGVVALVTTPPPGSAGGHGSGAAASGGTVTSGSGDGAAPAARDGGAVPQQGAMLAGAAPAAPSAPMAVMVGLALGALLYVLWGKPRRLAGTWKSEPLRHLLGRPLQATHAGNVCLYCGRLHLILFTRRDLWRAGKYCRPRCYISAEATEPPHAAHTADC